MSGASNLGLRISAMSCRRISAASRAQPRDNSLWPPTTTVPSCLRASSAVGLRSPTLRLGAGLTHENG